MSLLILAAVAVALVFTLNAALSFANPSPFDRQNGLALSWMRLQAAVLAWLGVHVVWVVVG